jgi:alanyl-tRNA synthetase
MRVDFLCGGRAVCRARSDYDALNRVAKLFSAALDDVPDLVTAQLETARNSDKQRRKLETELAEYQGRELYAATTPDAAGMRRVIRRPPSGALEDFRTMARSFTAQSKAIFVVALDQPPALLLAVSADGGLHAGQMLKAALAAAGGRGGGDARMAQGSLPGRESLEEVLRQLTL